MADKSKIEWTDATWNPVRGCSRVSEGCRHCYAETVANRFSGPGQPYEGLIARGGQWNGQIRLVPEKLEEPLRWRKPRMIFVNSMSDLFHENMPTTWIDQVFAVMALTSFHGRDEHHTFQILTKRPERMLAYVADGATPERVLAESERFGYPRLPANLQTEDERAGCSNAWRKDRFWPLPNVWLGVSAENQATADERIPLLLQTPAAVRWVSAEPLLGPVDLMDMTTGDGHRYNALTAWAEPDPDPLTRGIDWLVAGGESGPGARPAHPDWFRSLRDQCLAADVPFLFKQWGEWAPRETYASELMESDEIAGKWNGVCYRYGKKRAGRELDGRTWDEYPEVSHG